MRKILVVNMNYMGDALLTTPALAALRQANPDARIDTVVGAGSASDVLQGNPDVNRIISRTARGSWGRCTQIFKLLRESGYSDAIILPAIPAYALAVFAAGTPVRMGQANRGMNRFLTHLMPTTARHMADAMLETVGAAEAPAGIRRLTVVVDQKDYDFADELLGEFDIAPGQPLIALNLGATRPQKRWFAASFARLLDELAGFPSILVGSGPDDVELARQVGEAVHGAKPHTLVGRTSVKQLAAVLGRCAVLVSADSGPMHLATAVGTPVVALFGSTDPGVTGPYDTVSRTLYKALPCAPCFNHPTCNDRFDCLRAILPEEAAMEVRALLRERSASHVASLPMATAVTSITSPRAVREIAARPVFAMREATDETAETQERSGRFQRILIATKFRFIGDTLLAIPIFRAARRQWPDAHIVLLTGRNARVLLQHNPYLDEVIEFDPYVRDKGHRAFWRLIRRLRRSHFDLCLVLNRSFHSALVPWLSGIGTRSGFESENRGALLNRRVAYDRDKSEIACYFDVLRAVAPATPLEPGLELWVTPEESTLACDRLAAAFEGSVHTSSAVCLVGIQPGASQDSKRWPADRFAAVADRLVDANPGARIVLVGGPDEREIAEEMLAACAPATAARLASFVGACDLRESLAIISHLGLFVGNDTAVMHSAVALRVPTVALFGPTNPRKWGNYGDRHRVLESADGSMSGHTVDTVAAAAASLLQQSDRVGSGCEGAMTA
ncbi:MAG: lipopolysaccharide heptosyltransferase II [Capsulimonadaceae bacterium]